MAFEHPSGLANAYDRASPGPNRARMVWPEGVFVQGADLNELQSLEARRNRRGLNMTAQDGDRITGADVYIVLNNPNTTAAVTLSPGELYIAGDIRPVPQKVFASVPMTGEVLFGVRLQPAVKTHEDDPTLLGLHPGSWAEGEPGAARVEETLVWALSTEVLPGDFYPVYRMVDGTIIDNKAPPTLSGVVQQIARYDSDANGNYIVDGCEVVAIGKDANNAQVFSINAGTANIRGYKRIRETSIRFSEPEAPDLEVVAAETQTFTGTTGGSTVITVQRPPIANVTQAVVVKEVSEVVTRGPVPNGTDPLQFPSATAIVSVVQGGTTYTATTDYTLSNGTVSWAPGGSEPLAASTYTVTYRYNTAVTPAAVTDTTVTVTGGVNGTAVLLSYNSKLPRIDIIGLDIGGNPVYVKGISARQNGLAPFPPSNILKLAEVHNNWLGTPAILNNGTRNYTYDEQRRLFDRLIDVLDQFDRSEAERDILTREPVAKKGIFTETFVDDFYRDQGAAQTLAINKGVGMLAIDVVSTHYDNGATTTLPFEEEIIVRQDLRTSSQVIQPYMTHTILPGAMKLEPPVDHWTELAGTTWTSDQTANFLTEPDTPPNTTIITEVTEIRKTAAQTLRQITVQATITGFTPSENLATLTFDNINVKPAGTQTANGQGQIVLSFNIPAGVPTGRRRVFATGAAGSYAEAIFVGSGQIDSNVMRRTALVSRAAVIPPPVNVVNITNNVTNVTNVTEVVQDWTPLVANPQMWWVAQDVEGGGGGQGGNNDPLAQTFTLREGRHLVGINFRFTVIGNRSNDVRVQLCTTLNGYPTQEIMAEATVSMATIQVGDLAQARFSAPVYCRPGVEYAFVVVTTDLVHAIAISRLGDVDAATQQRVTAQPYLIGVMFQSANRSTWTPIQDADLHFQLVAAKFTSTTHTKTIYTGAITNISDVLVRGTVELPTDRTKFRYELVRADGTVIKLAPGQNYEASEFITETVTIRAVLEGNEKVSPILYPGTVVTFGRMRTSGTYITRQFPFGTSITVNAILATKIPAGATLTVECDAANGTWASMASISSAILGGGWNEPKHQRTSYTAANGRVRLTLTGTPAARPYVARLRAYTL